MKIPTLEEKGKWATIIGMIIGFPASIVLTVMLIIHQDYKYIPFSIAFGISLLFFMLPSSFSVSYKDFKIDIKD